MALNAWLVQGSRRAYALEKAGSWSRKPDLFHTPPAFPARCSTIFGKCATASLHSVIVLLVLTG